MSYPIEDILREQREEQGRKMLLGGLSQSPFNPLNSLVVPDPVQTKRKVFISYHHKDDVEVREFVKKWTETEKVFIPKGLGPGLTNDIINSNDSAYVMSQIRQKYLEDSTVTIVLLGTCTHSRRYVDWEIKASLRQEMYGLPNGLIGIVLPSKGNQAYIPPRFEANWAQGHVNCYVRFWPAPTTASELRGWIEDAFTARTSRAHLISNSSDMMKYNSTCKTCNVTHPA